MTTKSRFDYSASAELYFGKRTTRFRSIRYLRFETSAEPPIVKRASGQTNGSFWVSKKITRMADLGARS